MNKDWQMNTLNKRLKEVATKFKELKDCGMDEEILEIYLRHKTKLSRKDVRKLLSETEKFYEKLMKLEMIRELEK